jgi:hypothetical protein
MFLGYLEFVHFIKLPRFLIETSETTVKSKVRVVGWH